MVALAGEGAFIRGFAQIILLIGSIKTINFQSTGAARIVETCWEQVEFPGIQPKEP
jgi:hypothetical protein